ncbi:C40 family peptidase [Enterobacterales bacterium AE_CKDN230030158-1A_HGKHYDSX7]
MRPYRWIPLYLFCSLGASFALADDFDAPEWRRYDKAAIERTFLSDGFSARGLEQRALIRQAQRDLRRKVSTTDSQWRGEALLAAYPPARERKALSPQVTSRIIERAHELIGTPYRWGGESEASGFDCSGLLVYLYSTIANRRLPRTTTSMVAQKRNAVNQDELQPGDAVFFNHDGSGRTSHVGLYIGDGRFIHAPRTGRTIRIDSLDNSYWQRRYTTARRFSG